MTPERRNAHVRREVFRRLLEHVVQNPSARFDLPGFQRLLGVPEPAADRILTKLVSAGVLVEVQRGVWMRAWANVLPQSKADSRPH